jgi:hypothetical protein
MSSRSPTLIDVRGARCMCIAWRELTAKEVAGSVLGDSRFNTLRLNESVQAAWTLILLDVHSGRKG